MTLAPGNVAQDHLQGALLRLVLLDRDGKRERIFAKG